MVKLTVSRGAYKFIIEKNESASPLATEDLPAPWKRAGIDVLAPHVFDAAPLKGRQHLVVQVEKDEGGESYSVVFMGPTWPYRQKFEEADVDGGYIDADGQRDYVRCLRGLCFDEEGKDRLSGILGEAVLGGHVVALVDQTDETEDPFVGWLKSLDSVFER